MRTALMVVGLLSTVTASGEAADVRVITPERLEYRVEPSAPGAAIAVVAGDPKDGPYTIRARFRPGTTTPPHSHPDERVVTVLSGTYSFAAGPRFDAAALKDYGPGTVLVVPAGVVHFSAARHGEMVVQESGIGPAAFVPAPVKPSSP